MSSQEFKSFADFWPFYVREHSLPATRFFHFIGTTFGLVSLVLLFTFKSFWFLPAGLIVSYGFAWFSHFFY